MIEIQYLIYFGTYIIFHKIKCGIALPKALSFEGRRT